MTEPSAVSKLSHSDANNNKQCKDGNQVSSQSGHIQQTNASVFTVPTAMPLQSLSTLPLTLCAMNGQVIQSSSESNPSANFTQQHVSLPSGGLFLLNVPGANNSGLTAFSQLVACSNQFSHAQQQQAIPNQVLSSVLLGSNVLNLNSPNTVQLHQPTVSSHQQQQQQQSNANSQGITNIEVAAPPNQTSPAAFMLVPIQQLPLTNNNITPNFQSKETTTACAKNMQKVSPDVAPNTSTSTTCLNINTDEHKLSGMMLESKTMQTAQNINPSRQFSAPVVLPTNPQLIQHQASLSSILQHSPNFLGITQHMLGQAETVACGPTGLSASSPINDPQISSTMQTDNQALNTSSVDHKSADSQTNHDNMSTGPKSKSARGCPSRHSTAKISKLEDPNHETEFEYVKPHDNEMDHLNISAAASLQSGESSSPPNLVWNMGLDAFLSNNVNTEEKNKMRAKRKKGPAPKLDGNELCMICTDKASGYHYGVLTCEGCKGFFRRSVIKNSDYKCKSDGKCQMDTYMRRKCQHCRLVKCRAAGMKDDSVLSEVKAKRIKKEKDSPSVFMNISFDGDPIPTLSSQQRNLVEMLQANESRFQWPTQENVAKVTPWEDSGDTHKCRASRFAHFTELSILIVQLVVEFTKQLPGFLTVSREDQIVLLKACTIEVMLLRAAKQFDKKTKAINFLNGKFYDRNSFYRAGIQVEFVDPIFDFCHSMAKLGLDEAEYALLAAINTFSADRPNIKDLKKVEALQDSYVELLRVYLKIHHPSDPLMFPRTLMKLVELRSLNNYHSEQIFALKVQDKQLPPLLAEIWDM